MGGHGGHGTRLQRRRGGSGNMQVTHTKTFKSFPNLYYLLTCGYGVNHPGTPCPVDNPTYHMPNITRNESHMYANQGEIMVAQNKSLSDGTVAGMGWILANSISKA